MGIWLAIHFYSLECAEEFAKRVNVWCIDISAQVYKANCPPAALLKLPVIMSESLIDVMNQQLDEVLEQL